MSDPIRRPGLAALDAALASGDVEAARRAFLQLDADERSILEAQLGREAMLSAFRSARSVRRGPGLGRVIVLPGLMGSKLDSIDAGGDSDLVWFHPLRVFRGRLEDLQLSLQGEPLPPPHTIRPKELFPHVYLPILLNLQARWQTRALPFDWRVDVDKSAAALADEVRTWGNGEPIHLVTHSMGGVVARRFIQLFPNEWASMQDPSGQGRGGRLLMMGTPNRGSYAAVLALSGEEGIVKTLDKIDQVHDRVGLLRILNTFQGSYQLLPSPKRDLGGDDHKKLFDAANWGTLPVHQALLDKGKAFMTALDRVDSPERLIFVAGDNQETPHRIFVTQPGVFRYESTLAGDGRVPHELALLEGVATFWVVEKHGDLPKNAQVIAGIHDLLQKGTTTALGTRRAGARGVRESAPYDPRGRERVHPEVDDLMRELAPARAARKALTLEQEKAEARLEAVALQDWLGTPREVASRALGGPAAAGAERGRAASTEAPSLEVEVVWGDITQAKGDVFAVGHYRGVLPQRALRAVDEKISGSTQDPLVLTEQVRRGLLRGDLGDVEFFPWGKERLVAVAGMGHPGSFGEAQLRLLARNLTWAIANLPSPRTICTVLIGSGEGNLSVPSAVRAIFLGLADALVDTRVRSHVERLRIVELHRDRAQAIQEAVLSLKDVSDRVILLPKRKLTAGAGRGISSEDGLALLLESAVRASAAPAGSPARKAVADLLKGASSDSAVRRQVTGRIETLAREAKPRALRVEFAKQSGGSAIPARLSFIKAADAMRAAAITHTATVPERSLRLDPKLVDELVVRMSDPDIGDVGRLSGLLRRLLLPREFAQVLQESPLFIFEVDRHMARVHWEMLAWDLTGADRQPLATRLPVARQLRTEYSPPPAPEARPGQARRALVIGDPGDPAKGHSLPGARREALRVAEIFRAKGLEEVACYVGAPGDPEQESLGVPAATRIDVLDRLLEGGWDILHYAGHGDFDPNDSTRAGWVFKDGLLTARELERMDTAPRLVVANACLSSKTSFMAPGGNVFGKSDADLLPSLADEFFRRGVRDYIGTAWEVNDEGAILFAEVLYETLFTAPGSPPCSLGSAMLRARQSLEVQQDIFGALWAAYQHYGDPTAFLVDLSAAGRPPAGGPRAARSANRRPPRRRARGR